jgi:DNA sulfur modification protein DndE
MIKPPVDHVRVSANGREILIKIKRRTGLEHWNEICRVALCRSLANPTRPAKAVKSGESAVDMEWKTFAGDFGAEITSAIVLRASQDEIDLKSRDSLAEYVKAHIERGIASLQNVKSLGDLVK